MGESGLINVRHPLPNDVVATSFLVAGLGSGHEGEVQYRVVTETGKEVARGFTAAGAMSMRDFSKTIELDPGVEGAGGTLEVFWLSPKDNDPLGQERDKVKVPIVFGFKIMDDYVGVSLYEVKSGETLTTIANGHFVAVTPDQIFNANRDVLSDPDQIFPGQVLRVPGNL